MYTMYFDDQPCATKFSWFRVGVLVQVLKPQLTT